MAVSLALLAGCGGNIDPSAATPEPLEGDATLQAAASSGVRVILDTDLGIDVDDAGALAILHALADQGEARILATVANVHDPHAPGALDAINTYYGRPGIPVGRNPRRQYAVATPYWREHHPRFVRDLDLQFPEDTATTNLKTAVAVYRKALAAQPDASVTVISVGFMQNLADLMASGTDRYSSLSGAALIRRKVKQLVVMGGTYPGSDRDLYLKGGRDISPAPAVRSSTTGRRPSSSPPGVSAAASPPARRSPAGRPRVTRCARPTRSFSTGKAWAAPPGTSARCFTPSTALHTPGTATTSPWRRRAGVSP